MTSFRRFAMLAVAAPLTLAIAACGNDEGSVDGAETPEGDPIAAIDAPAGQNWVDMAAVTPEGGVVVGNPDAPIKLVEYASHTCGACANFAAASAEPLRNKYISTGVVSFELRNLIRDGLDLTIAQMVRCGEPESTLPLADQAWANLEPIFQTAQSNEAAMSAAMQGEEAARYTAIAEAAGLYDFFAARGISRDQAQQCLSDPEKGRTILDNSQNQAKELDITSTPTFLLNGKNIGNHTWQSIEPILQRAGAREFDGAGEGPAAE